MHCIHSNRMNIPLLVPVVKDGARPGIFAMKFEGRLANILYKFLVAESKINCSS
jgi:hypothetical protein